MPAPVPSRQTVGRRRAPRPFVLYCAGLPRCFHAAPDGRTAERWAARRYGAGDWHAVWMPAAPRCDVSYLHTLAIS